MAWWMSGREAVAEAMPASRLTWPPCPLRHRSTSKRDEATSVNNSMCNSIACNHRDSGSSRFVILLGVHGTGVLSSRFRESLDVCGHVECSNFWGAVGHKWDTCLRAGTG
jgi:hypothetical protein